MSTVFYKPNRHGCTWVNAFGETGEIVRCDQCGSYWSYGLFGHRYQISERKALKKLRKLGIEPKPWTGPSTPHRTTA